MKQVIDTSELLGTMESPHGPCEVCPAADANYDEEKSRLVVRLTSFLHTTDIRSKEKLLSADRLPKAETVTEAVGAAETVDLAREIFSSLGEESAPGGAGVVPPGVLSSNQSKSAWQPNI